MKRILLIVVLAALAGCSPAWAIQPGRTLPLFELKSQYSWYKLSDVVESTQASELHLPVRVTAYPSAPTVPVLLQCATLSGLSRTYGFGLTVQTSAGRVLCREYRGTSGTLAVTRIWAKLVPNQDYLVTLHLPPSEQRTRRVLGVGLWKYWVPRFDLHVKLGVLGDGHTAEFD